jgi:hypothetical protein
MQDRRLEHAWPHSATTLIEMIYERYGISGEGEA